MLRSFAPLSTPMVTVLAEAHSKANYNHQARLTTGLIPIKGLTEADNVK